MTHDNIIFDLSKKFALRVIRLYVFLSEERKEYVMSKQIYRSGTSIGANIAESINAQSKADFVSKLSISLKEKPQRQNIGSNYCTILVISVINNLTLL